VPRGPDPLQPRVAAHTRRWAVAATVQALKRAEKYDKLVVANAELKPKEIAKEEETTFGFLVEDEVRGHPTRWSSCTVAVVTLTNCACPQRPCPHR
jgi:hypothetical protein